MIAQKMIVRPLTVAVSLLFCFSAANSVPAREPLEGVPIFDGKTFEGWEGNMAYFRIEGDAVVAGNLKTKIPRNEFLCTKKSYGDFELTLKVKVKGNGANAGIQFRSHRAANYHEVVGYQADVGKGWWGKLYDEARRRKLLAVPANEAEYNKHVKLDGWNDYRIRCAGKRIQLWINGYQTVDFIEQDNDIARDGIIGLQIHSGPPCEAWYKDLRLTDLGGTPAKSK